MMKKASIIIRTKNEEKWISICLNAIFKQDYKNFEVIIVDNCSTDKTVEKAKTFVTGVPAVVDALANEIKSVVLAKFNQLANYPVLFLDYLRSYEGEDVDMTPFYEGLPVEFGDTEEPDEEIPMEGT